jgi:hypothetical protein
MCIWRRLWMAHGSRRLSLEFQANHHALLAVAVDKAVNPRNSSVAAAKQEKEPRGWTQILGHGG